MKLPLVLAAALTMTACSSSEVLSGSGVSSGSSSYAPASQTYKSRHVSPKFGDADRVRFKGKHPSKFAVHGVDVSRYNTKVNWKTAAQAGVRFAFIKATEGRENVDKRFRSHWKGASAAGIPRSAYHFYYFCASPAAQAKNYIRTVPKTANSLPPVLDVEWNPHSPTCRKRPNRRKVVRDVGKFLKIIERHYGQKPIMYVTIDFYRDNFSRGELPGYQYWLRSVKAEPKHVYGKRPWTFWQYSGTGLASGFKGEVDLNVFKGGEKAWKRWVKANTRG